MRARLLEATARAVGLTSLGVACSQTDERPPPPDQVCSLARPCFVDAAAGAGGDPADASGEGTAGMGTSGAGGSGPTLDATVDVGAGDSSGNDAGADGAADAFGADARRSDADVPDVAPEDGSADGALTDVTAEAPGGDASDAGPDAVVAECAAYCACMGGCSTFPGYPFASAAACAVECQGWDQADRACWFYFCIESLSPGALKSHLCEHAWGAYGRLECP